MTTAEKQLISLMRAYMHHTVPDDHMHDAGQALWVQLFELAESHKLTPAAFDRLSVLPDIAQRIPAPLYEKWRQRARVLAVMQTRFDAQLASVLERLSQEEICYVLIKGALCRTLYQNGSLRISADEDIIVSEHDFARTYALFEAMGFTADPLSKDDVVHFRKPDGMHVELHKKPFADDTALNNLFLDELSFRKEWDMGFGYGFAFSETANFLMLVLHAKKHFTASGFGLRTLADIAQFAMHYGNSVDWEKAEAILSENRAMRFTQAVFSLAKTHLGFSCAAAGCPDYFVGTENEEDLLADILDAGIYGQSSMSRIHSASMTAAANSSKKQAGIAAALFPKPEVIKRQYHYAERFELLLPLAYVQRIFRYVHEVCKGAYQDDSPNKSIRIAKERMNMLRKYGMIE